MNRRAVKLSILSLIIMAAGCVQAARRHDGRYALLCVVSRVDSSDRVEQVLDAHGIRYTYGLTNFGGSELLVRGPQETLFLARRLITERARERGKWVSWPADALLPHERYDGLGFDQ